HHKQVRREALLRVSNSTPSPLFPTADPFSHLRIALSKHQRIPSQSHCWNPDDSSVSAYPPPPTVGVEIAGTSDPDPDPDPDRPCGCGTSECATSECGT